jgi:hypothetical protein
VADWTYLLADPAGIVVTELRVQAKHRYDLNAGSTVTLTGIDLRSDEADAIYSQLAGGLPQLHAFRDGDRKFGGRFAPSADQSSSGDATVDMTFQSPIAELASRYLVAASEFPSPVVGEQSGQYAWRIIAQQNASFTARILPGTIQTTTVRVVPFEAGQQVLDALQQLTKFADGFDFLERPMDPTVNSGFMSFIDILNPAGVDRTATLLFQHGPGTLDNVLSVQRQITMPVNHAAVFGTIRDAAGNETPLAATVLHGPSQAKYGRFSKVEANVTVASQGDGVARANNMIVPDPTVAVTFEPDPATAPGPWDDFWLGDWCGLYANSGAMQVDAAQRITAIEVDTDETLTESAYRLEVGDQRFLRSLTPVLATLSQRLSALERK